MLRHVLCFVCARAQEYVKTTLARMARVLPAFGAGGVLNKAVRRLAHEDQARKYGYTPTDTPVA
jgi:hypothetical protein